MKALAALSGTSSSIGLDGLPKPALDDVPGAAGGLALRLVSLILLLPSVLLADRIVPASARAAGRTAPSSRPISAS